jgi:hypothetical protein
MVTAYSDSDWGGSLDNTLSRTGCAIFLGSALISWTSKLQMSQGISTLDAEYMALAKTTQSVLWLHKILSELGFTQHQASIVYEDNKSCCDVASSYKSHPGLKHTAIKYHFIRDHVLTHKSIVINKI